MSKYNYTKIVNTFIGRCIHKNPGIPKIDIVIEVYKFSLLHVGDHIPEELRRPKEIWWEVRYNLYEEALDIFLDRIDDIILTQYEKEQVKLLLV